MNCELIDSMGTDLTVVNAARVSFDKESDWEVHNYDEEDLVPKEEQASIDWDYVMSGTWYGGYPTKTLSTKDQKLIKYLATHNHWTPFSHVQITVRETVPIFVARQRFKHVVGFTYNEISRRYVDSPPDFFYPKEWRRAADNKKQGSSDEAHQDTEYFSGEYKEFVSDAQSFYEALIRDGVAPEQARMVLPQSMYTSYYVTGSLAAWARAYTLRSEEHAQKEIRDLADQWNTIISNIKELEHSWNALTSTS